MEGEQRRRRRGPPVARRLGQAGALGHRRPRGRRRHARPGLRHRRDRGARHLASKEFGEGKLEIVYPPSSILAEPPVAVVDKVVERRGTKKLAEAYLNHLYSAEGQEIAAQNFYRPIDAAAAARHSARFPKLALYSIDEAFGGWASAQKTHFADGGVFDQIVAR